MGVVGLRETSASWVPRVSYREVVKAIGFPGGSVVKILPAMQETQVRSLGQEDPLEKGMEAHSSILAGKSHGQRSLEGCM